MTPDEFIFKLKNLHPDTPLKPSDLIAALEALSPKKTSSTDDIDTYPNSKLIGEEKLAERIDESVSTIQKWRLSGKGPKYIRKPRHVSYRVGDVRDWLESLTVRSTTESDAKKTSW